MTIKGMLSGLKLGYLGVQLGCYLFSEKSLRDAIYAHKGHASTLKKLISPWNKDLALSPGGFPTSVGMALIKK